MTNSSTGLNLAASGTVESVISGSTFEDCGVFEAVCDPYGFSALARLLTSPSAALTIGSTT